MESRRLGGSLAVICEQSAGHCLVLGPVDRIRGLEGPGQYSLRLAL